MSPNTLKRYLILLISSFLLTACSHKPVEYYVFTANTNPPISTSSSPRDYLMVNHIQVVSNFDSTRIFYQRTPNNIEFFLNSRWLNSPADMLQPLLVQKLEETGAFNAVIPMPSDSLGRYRVDLTLTQLKQYFDEQNNRAEIGFNLRLFDTKNERLVFNRQYTTTRTFTENSVRAGVSAINQGLDELLSTAVYDIVQRLR